MKPGIYILRRCTWQPRACHRQNRIYYNGVQSHSQHAIHEGRPLCRLVCQRVGEVNRVFRFVLNQWAQLYFRYTNHTYIWNSLMKCIVLDP